MAIKPTTNPWIDVNPKYTQNRLADRITADLAISQGSFYNLLNTMPGDESRIFRTKVGSYWRTLLQENITDVTAAKMEMLILDAIAKWEPRITLHRSASSVVPDFRIPGYRVRIQFTTHENPTPQTVAFSVTP